MKFNNLFALLVASTALANNIPMKRDEFEDEAQNLGQLADSVDPEAEVDPLAAYNTKECEPFNSDIAKCLGFEDKSANEVCQEFNCNVIEKTLDDVCTQFNSQECQAVLKKDFTKCAPFAINIASLRLNCAKDEKGEYCPIAVAQQNNSDFTDTLIQDTCKSKSCTENGLEGFKTLKNLAQEVSASTGETVNGSDYDDYIKALSEDKCTAASKSGASQIKVGGALLFTLALALSYF